MSAPGVIYFIRDSASGAIKIGFAADIRARLWSLAGALPSKPTLLLIVAGCPVLERQVHAHFAEAHLRAEWFEPSDRLVTFIDDLRRAGLGLEVRTPTDEQLLRRPSRRIPKASQSRAAIVAELAVYRDEMARTWSAPTIRLLAA